MEILFELLFEFLIQLFLEVFVQGAFELGVRGIAKRVRGEKPANPWVALGCYAAMGLLAGGVSVWILPMYLLDSPLLQLVNLAVTPIVLGLAFEGLGRWRSKRDKPRYAVDRFSYGFVFALVMGLVRYFLVV